MIYFLNLLKSLHFASTTAKFAFLTQILAKKSDKNQISTDFVTLLLQRALEIM